MSQRHSKSTLSYLIPSFINEAFSEVDPVIQMVQDESRHNLYTRSEKGSIDIYDLGTGGQAMSRVAFINISNIVKSATNIARTVNRFCFKPSVCIAPIGSTESTNLHLVAITASGVRLYFSTLNWCSFNEATRSTPSYFTK
jgi:nuclear pore complex protein Nup155